MKSPSSPFSHVSTAAHSRPHGIARFYVGAPRHEAEQCVTDKMPAHSRKIGNQWVCDIGYKRVNDQCVRFKVPAHASVFENTWVCDAGYRRDGEQCFKFTPPANARIVDNDWICLTGYERRGEQCVKFAVPENARAMGNTWMCNSGFTQVGEQCVKLDILRAQEAGSVPGGEMQLAMTLKSDDAASGDDEVVQPSAAQSGVLPFLLVLLAAVLTSYGLFRFGRFQYWLAAMQRLVQRVIVTSPRENTARQDRQAEDNHRAGQNPRGAPENEGMNPKNAALDPKANWYTILCVAENSSREEIRKAYRRMIAQYHPDKVEQLGEEIRALAQSKTKQINLAYDYAMTLRQSS